MESGWWKGQRWEGRFLADFYPSINTIRHLAATNKPPSVWGRIRGPFGEQTNKLKLVASSRRHNPASIKEPSEWDV